MAFEGAPLDSHDVWQTFLAMWFASFDFMFPFFFVQAPLLACWISLKKLNLIPSIVDENPTIPKNTYSDSWMSLEKKLCWGKLLHFHFGSAECRQTNWLCHLRSWPIPAALRFPAPWLKKLPGLKTRFFAPQKGHKVNEIVWKHR